MTTSRSGDLLAGNGEPEWHLRLTDPLDIAAARGTWLRITEEMRAAARWSPVNEHAVERLVIAYLLYDRAARIVLGSDDGGGAVVASRKTKVPQYSLHLTVMNQMATLAAALEAELMLSPRKRGKVPMKAANAPGRAVKAL